MAQLDDETLERVRRWCAEAGRQVGPAEIRAALAPLSWDELLHARALLVDPPPARPLGPAALADLARGTPPDVAAEREREGRYRAEEVELPPQEPADTVAAPRPASPRSRRAGLRRPSPPVIHRHRDRTEPAPPASPAAPPFESLLDPPGRAVLERLVREHGARRAFLLRELAAWRTAQGAAPTDLELSALLEHHGLARAFAHRERDELLHALRAARGDRAAAAARVGLEREAFGHALDRLGATEDAEKLREERRAELRGRATIAERCRLLSAEADHLSDLGILAEVARELRDRMGEHLRALRAGHRAGSLGVAFARSVSLEVDQAVALARQLGVELEAPAARSRPGAAPALAAGTRPGVRSRKGTRPPARTRSARPERTAIRQAGRGKSGPARAGTPRPRPGGARRTPRAGPRKRR
jgi:hypothetical protein